MKKTITIICVLLLVAAVVGFTLITSANAKKAEEIHETFLGLTFRGTGEDDGGFARDYKNGELNEYATYWKTTTKCSLIFNEDGTVGYTQKVNEVVLAYPRIIEEPKDREYEDEGTYSSFEIKVEFDGDVILILGGREYVVWWDEEENRPLRIWDYKGVDLH